MIEQVINQSPDGILCKATANGLKTFTAINRYLMKALAYISLSFMYFENVLRDKIISLHVQVYGKKNLILHPPMRGAGINYR